MHSDGTISAQRLRRDIGRRTAYMLLFRGTLIRVCCFLDVYDEFPFRLVLVYWTRWIVHIVAVNIVIILPRPRTGIPVTVNE